MNNVPTWEIPFDRADVRQCNKGRPSSTGSGIKSKLTAKRFHSSWSLIEVIAKEKEKTPSQYDGYEKEARLLGQLSVIHAEANGYRKSAKQHKIK